MARSIALSKTVTCEIDFTVAQSTVPSSENHPTAQPAEQAEGHIPLTPQLAHQWQMLTFAQFLAQVPHRRLRGLDREAWTAFASAVPEKQYNMAKREAQVLKTDTPFAKNLQLFRDKLKLPVLPVPFNLPRILKDIQQDDHVQAVEVYIRLSRGVEILSPESSAVIKPSRVSNYKAKTPLLKKQAGPELQRHFDKKFVAEWDELKKQYPDIGEPHNIHAFGVQPKNDQVCRLTLDATNNGTDEYPSVNEIDPNPPCCLPTMKHLTAAMSPFGNISIADDVDAYPQHRVRPSSYKHACCTDFRTGKIICFRCLPLGFSVSSAVQQDTMVCFIRAFRRRLRERGLHTSGTDPEFHKPWKFTKPEKGHSLTTSLGYSDDTANACTSWASGIFSQIHYLMMKYEWGIEVGFKPGKTEPVSKEALWIGYLFNCSSMTVALTAERLDKMKLKLLPFRRDPALNLPIPDISDAKNLMGVLGFGANIIYLGKAYMAETQKRITILDRNSKFGKARPNTPFIPDERTRHMADMWDALINTLSVRSAYIGIRRKVFPHTAQSDASFSPVRGWCWAQMGNLKNGRWPESWLEKIGHHSKYAEIFITELECLAILFCARFMFPRCRHMRWEGYSDNMGAVFMLNKLTARSERIQPIITEILWLAAAFDVEIHYAHVPTHRNILTDAGTRQEQDKEFERYLAEYRIAYPPSWVAEQERLFPIAEPARPELFAAMPVVHRDIFEVANLDLGEMAAVLPAWIAEGLVTTNEERTALFLQENATASYSSSS